MNLVGTGRTNDEEESVDGTAAEGFAMEAERVGGVLEEEGGRTLGFGDAGGGRSIGFFLGFGCVGGCGEEAENGEEGWKRCYSHRVAVV